MWVSKIADSELKRHQGVCKLFMRMTYGLYEEAAVAMCDDVFAKRVHQYCVADTTDMATGVGTRDIIKSVAKENQNKTNNYPCGSMWHHPLTFL